MRRKTNDEFLSELHSINPDVLPLEEYKSASTKIKCKSKKYGFIWYATPSSLLEGHSAPQIQNLHNSERLSFSYEDACKKIEETTNGQISINKDDYINYTTKTKCHCNYCGRDLYLSPDYIYHRGIKSCKYCNTERRGWSTHKYKTNEEFLGQLKEVNRDIRVHDVYKSEREDILCECLVCGYRWYIKPVNLLIGHGCPNCRCSHGERLVSNYLRDNKIRYEKEKTFDDLIGIHGRCLRFDFYLPELNIAIEFNGGFHNGDLRAKTVQSKAMLVTQRIHDHRKQVYCKEHNIKLITIWYYEKQKMSKILDMYLK